MAVAPFSAGSKLRASRLNELITYMTRLTASKSSDTSRASDTTRAVDPHLVVPMAANTTYDLRALIIGTSAANAAGDLSAHWQYPSDGVFSFVALGLVDTLASGSSADLQAGAVALDTVSPTAQFVVGLSTSTTGTFVVARVSTVTAGDLSLYWAQNTSSASASTLKGGSYVTLTPVG